jgi:hypothetical protein
LGLLDGLFGGPSLEDALRALARADTPEGRAAFYAALVESRLLLAAPGAVGSGKLVPGESVAVEGTRIPFIARTGPDGAKTALAFTSQEALLAWRPEGCDSVELSARDLARAVLGAGARAVALNPSGPAGGLLPEEDLRALADGWTPGAAGQKASLEGLPPLRAPGAPPPAAAVEALRCAAAQAAGLRSVRWADAELDGAWRPVLLVELAAGAEPDAVLPGFIEAALAGLAEGTVPDALVLPAGQRCGEGLAVFER